MFFRSTLFSILILSCPWLAGAQAPVSAPAPDVAPLSLPEQTPNSAIAVPGPANAYAALGEKLAAKIDALDWQEGKVSIVVRDARLPITVIERDGDRPMAAGSLTQIVTAAAALDALGPSYRFSTELFAVAPDPEAKTAKAILVRGTGDPSISMHYVRRRKDLWTPLDEWAAAIKKARISTIDGPIIGDGTVFDDERLGIGWPMEKIGEGAYPSVSALNFNHNEIELDWTAPKKIDVPPALEIFPKFEQYIFVSSNVKVAENYPSVRTYRRVREGNLISVTGLIAPKEHAVEHAAIDDPARFFAEALRSRIVERGINVIGPAINRLNLPGGTVPGRQVSIGLRFSPPLSEMLLHMMRDDEALEAEVFFKTLGRRHAQAEQPGDAASGIEAIREFMEGLRLPGGTGNFVDGSGRTELNRASANQIVELIRKMRGRGDLGAVFDGLFPQAGSPGILAGRFQPAGPRNKTAALPIWAKTASGERFEAMAGRAIAGNGNSLVFMIGVEGSRLPAETLRRQIDAVAAGLAQ